MKAILLSCLLLCIGLFFAQDRVWAQSPQPEVPPVYYKGVVTSIQKEGSKPVGGKPNLYQMLSVRVLDGPDKGKVLSIEHGGMFTITASQKVSQGETIILRKVARSYSVADRYRLPAVEILLIGFFLIVWLIAGKKGIGAILGMLFSLGVIMWFIIPQILSGADPVSISVLGSCLILGVTMYLAHGFTKVSHIALAATALSLVLTALLALFFVNVSKLSGLGSEDAYSLQQGFGGIINFQGLLLGGIIIGALGVLDDVTTTQAATIHELAESNPKNTFQELITKGMRIGRDHIASVVNTLVLAYAGASIGLFIYLHLGIQNNAQPLWVMLNSEVIMEEIVRTLAGSLGLILAVPITTILAAFFAKNEIKFS